jgi:hypothetical protein
MRPRPANLLTALSLFTYEPEREAQRFAPKRTDARDILGKNPVSDPLETTILTKGDEVRPGDTIMISSSIPYSKPAHQATPEAVARGNALLLQAKIARDRGIALQESIESFEELKEAAFAEARKCHAEATKLMVGTERY